MAGLSEQRAERQESRKAFRQSEVSLRWLAFRSRAHLLAGASRQSPARDKAREQLAEIAKEIEKGTKTMAAAGKELGGQDGEAAARPQWVTGSGPLMPAIIDVVLKTQVGSMSVPFDSAQGVHVVRVLQSESGKRTLEEARDDVRKHMLLYLLDFLAQKSAEELPLKWIAK